MLKRSAVIFCLVVLSFINLIAQDESGNRITSPKFNEVFVEIHGQGFQTLSFNYKHSLTNNLGIRIGAGIYANQYSFPVGIVFNGDGLNTWELGASAVPVIYEGRYMNSNRFFVIGNAGYRVVLPDYGLILRAGVNPIYDSDYQEVDFMLGFSVGYKVNW